ncbi:F-type H+-transporting ATPase subunit epsilon [Thermoflexales bacterium]|nr:F-type H+-transporting ATPase subunit epsilon [Thermoflexales bacterium]
MATLHVEIVTQEKRLFSGEADMIIAPGGEGELGILPHHAPLLTTLKEGVLRVKQGGNEEYFTIGGGFMEVQPDHVVVLADVAEKADDIDIARAEEAKQRAEQLLKDRSAGVDIDAALASLRRAQIRIAVAQKRGTRRADVPDRRKEQ